jgi:hypothetical protein
LLTTWQKTEAAMIADLQLQVAELTQAYSLEGQNFIIKKADGTPTHVNYVSAACFGGVRVTEPPSFPDGRGVELVTKRTYTVTLQAIELVAASQLHVILQSFHETLDFSGGGKRRALLETLIGLPQAQMLRQHTIFTVRQSGSAVGLFQYPTVPFPLWPTERTEEMPKYHQGHPERIGDNYRNFPINWSWEFASAYTLIGQPHIWGLTWGS